MQHQVEVTVIRKNCFADLQADYLANPTSGPCPCFEEGQVYRFQRTPEVDSFYKLGRDTLVCSLAGEACGPTGEPCGLAALNRDFPCGEAWDCISRYVYAGLQGGSLMSKWTNDERMMIACCNDGTRPVVFRIERKDIPETEAEAQWLAAQDFSNSQEDAYTG